MWINFFFKFLRLESRYLGKGKFDIDILMYNRMVLGICRLSSIFVVIDNKWECIYLFYFLE